MGVEKLDLCRCRNGEQSRYILVEFMIARLVAGGRNKVALDFYRFSNSFAASDCYMVNIVKSRNVMVKI